MKTYRKVRAEISRSALENNYKVMEKLANGAKMLCIVKAGAYGHGIFSASVFHDMGCRDFAVASCREALELRRELNKSGKEGEILLLGYTDPRNVNLLNKADITFTVFSKEYALALLSHLKGDRIKIQIKLNTGMNRLGFSEGGLDDCLEILNDPRVDCRGIFTHFACADEPERDTTAMQMERFDKYVQYLESKGANFPVKHVSNSAAAFYFDKKYDMIRAGVSLYGLSPAKHLPVEGLIPVMTLKTCVAQVQRIAPGEGVSYGLEYVADTERTLACLPIGYADGFIRAFKGAYVTIKGKKAPLLGRICMDMCIADITDIPNVNLGDEVTVFGFGGMSIDELAAKSGTIGIEITSLVSRRVKRIMVD